MKIVKCINPRVHTTLYQSIKNRFDDHKKRRLHQMFGTIKKARKQQKNIKNNIKELKQQGINTKHFEMFLKSKDLYFPDVTPELIDEYNNRENIILKLALPCRLTLPEMYSEVNNFTGATVGLLTGKEHNFTATSREQIKVDTNAVIVRNGIVFKGALNKTKDLRVPWEDINNCKIELESRLFIKGFIQVGDIKYPLDILDKELGLLFFKYVENNMEGYVDDGWS